MTSEELLKEYLDSGWLDYEGNEALRDVLARLKAAEADCAEWIRATQPGLTMDECRAAARANIASRAKAMEGGAT